MNFKALAEFTGLSSKAVKYLADEGILIDPLQEHNIFFMQDLAKIWGKPQFIKLQTARYNTAKRARIVFSAGLDKVESYALHRWLAHYADRDEKITLHVSQVVDETMQYLNLPVVIKPKVTATAYKMRQKARNLVYRHKENLVEAVNAITQPKKSRHEKRLSAQHAARLNTTSTPVTQNDIFGWYPANTSVKGNK